MHLDEVLSASIRNNRKLTERCSATSCPIIVGWSFMLLPTDLICYVCGSLKINFPKFLFGVVLGEGTVTRSTSSSRDALGITEPEASTFSATFDFSVA